MLLQVCKQINLKNVLFCYSNAAATVSAFVFFNGLEKCIQYLMRIGIDKLLKKNNLSRTTTLNIIRSLGAIVSTTSQGILLVNISFQNGA